MKSQDRWVSESNAFSSSMLIMVSSFRSESLCNNRSGSNTHPYFYLILLNLQSPFPVTFYKPCEKGRPGYEPCFTDTAMGTHIQSSAWVHPWSSLTLRISVKDPLCHFYFSILAMWLHGRSFWELGMLNVILCHAAVVKSMIILQYQRTNFS